MKRTPQREHWVGKPIELDDACMLRAGDRVARCLLATHELRLASPADLLRSQVYRSPEEVLTRHEAWKVAMRSKGWSG